MADGATERLTILLQARDKDFAREVEKMNRRLDKAARQASNTTYNMRRTLEADMAASGRAFANFARRGVAAIGLIAAQMTGGALRNAIRSVADMVDQADRIGVDAETFQGLQGGFLLSGVSAEKGAAALEIFTQRLGEAVEGSGPLYEALRKNGIAITDSQGGVRSTIEVLRDYADLIQSLPSQAERLAAANDAFGRGGRGLVLALEGGSDGIDEMIASARAAGLVLDEELVRRAAELDDKFDILTQRVGIFFKTIVVDSAGAIESVLSFQGAVDKLTLVDPVTEGALGAQLTNALVAAGGATAEQEQQIAMLASEYTALQMAARDTASALLEAVPVALEQGQDDLAKALTKSAHGLNALVTAFSDGSVEGADFEAQMHDVAVEAASALSQLIMIDGVSFGGAITAVGGLVAAIARVAGVAAAARVEIQTLATMQATTLPVDPRLGIPLPSNGPNGFGTDLAISTALRPQRPSVDASFGIDVPDFSGGGTSPGGGGPSGGGGGAAQLSAYAQMVASTRDEIAKLEIEAVEIAAVAASGMALGDALDYARQRAELLYAAQSEGREITPELRAEIDQLALSLTTAGQNAETAAEKLDLLQQNAERGADALTNVFLAALDGADSAKEAVISLLLEIAKVQATRAFADAAAAGGGGGIFGFLGSLLSGTRAGGGGVRAGSAYLVNENTPNSEVFVPSQSGGILNVPQAQAALRGGSGGGTVRVIIEEAPGFAARVRTEAQGVAVQVVRRAAPGIVGDAVGAVYRANSEVKLA